MGRVLKFNRVKKEKVLFDMIKKLFIKIFYEWKWICAYRTIDKNDKTLPRPEKKYKYNLIDMPRGYWAADPFVYQKDGNVDIFFELFDINKRKAFLGHKRLNKREKKIDIIYEFEGHTSYPCIFDFEGTLYIIPETKADEQLVLLECVDYPDKWIKKSVLMSKTNTVDSTPVKLSGKYKIFLYEENTLNIKVSTLSLGELDIKNGKVCNVVPIINYSKSIGRPAGNIIVDNDKMFRVTQLGIKHYGEGLSFLEFKYDNGLFVEQEVTQLLPEQIVVDSDEKIKGVHTFNRCGNIEIIDILTVGHFSLVRPVRYFLQKFGWFGFRDNDKLHKQVYREFPVSIRY